MPDNQNLTERQKKVDEQIQCLLDKHELSSKADLAMYIGCSVSELEEVVDGLNRGEKIPNFLTYIAREFAGSSVRLAKIVIYSYVSVFAVVILFTYMTKTHVNLMYLFFGVSLFLVAAIALGQWTRRRFDIYVGDND